MSDKKTLEDVLREITALRLVVVGQAASMALLAGLLVDHEVLTREEAIMIALAASEAGKVSGLKIEQVRDWVSREMAKRGPRPTETHPGAPR